MKSSFLRNPICFKVLATIVFIIVISCQRNDYDLLDPDSAGKWTLFTTVDGLPSNQVRDINLDSKGNIWFTFPGYGSASYDDDQWTFYRTATTPILNDEVICTAETASGEIIFGTADGLSILSDNNVWSSYNDTTNTLYVNTIKVASNGWICIWTLDKGFYVNEGSGFKRIDTVAASADVNVIEEGRSGNIYIGTNNGLIEWDGSEYSFLTTSDGLPDNKVNSLLYDSKERLWVGMDAGRTASWIDDNGIHQLNLMTGKDSVSITDICEDRSGNIWFATMGDGVIRYNGIVPDSFLGTNGFPEDEVLCIGEDKYGNLWFGLNSKGLVRYTLPIGIQ
jgi:ligand-binding sensor domain-containing protein